MSELLQTTEQPAMAVVPADVSAGALEAAIGMGDFSKLTSSDRLRYIAAVCQTTGLNPLTKPFDIMSISGKVVLYANKGCAEQLRKIHGVSLAVKAVSMDHGCYSVRIAATDQTGRTDENIGVVPLADNAPPDVRANAMMKAHTKAARRVTLSICGLGMLDESEVETIRHREPSSVTDAPTAVDTAAALNAEIVDAKPEEPDVSALLESVRFAMVSLIPGKDTADAKRKADVMQEVFGCRSWLVVQHLTAEQLQAGLDLLKAKLAAAAAEPAEEPGTTAAPPVTSPPKVEPPAPQPAKTGLVPAPAPANSPVTPPNGKLPFDKLSALEDAIGAENGLKAIRWMREARNGWLTSDQTLEDLKPERAERILKNPAGFAATLAKLP